MIIASLRALWETDLKKIVALSTLSQLGVIILSIRIGAYSARFFHLLSHAFFKALLFLSAGTIIHNCSDYQDLRTIGSSTRALPVTNRFTVVAIIRLIGVPFISAFFSKDLIIDLIIILNFNFWVYLIMIIGIFLTSIYRSRFLLLIFSNFSDSFTTTIKLEERRSIVKSMLLLLVPASVGGFFFVTFFGNR
jgi:NADH:ubiquinone oxidoreductase subunit 5 (subunit L)/multisubunit Na+/H+ antiporter MnhA subunit